MDLSNGKVKRPIWRFVQCEYDELEGQLWVVGIKVDLLPKTKAVLLALLKATDAKLTRKELLTTVWGEAEGMEQSLANAVNRLRTAISPDDRDSVIRTLHGSGFQVIVPVERRTVEESVREGIRFTAGDSVPGKRDWKLTTPLDGSLPHRVWLAERPTTGHIHVFKFAEDGASLEQLRREIETCRKLERKGVTGFVKVVDWRDTTKPYFMETEYGGQDLAAWATAQRAAGDLQPETCLQVMADLVGAVAAMHENRVLHNDLQPANVLVSPPGGSGIRWQVKLANFHAASLTENEQAAERNGTGPRSGNGMGSEAGSVMYKAPELAAGEPPSEASDVYALGMILFQLLCGGFHRTLTPDWESFIDDPLLRLDIAAATNGDAKRRLGSAMELGDRLRSLEARNAQVRAAAEELQQARERAEVAERRVTESNARRPWIAAAIAALILGVLLSLWFFRRAMHERDLANSRSAALAAMNDFFSVDLLGQANPLKRHMQDGQVQRETLLDAIGRALPQIDRRFHGEPKIAGQLHETIAAALDAQTQLFAADQQFSIAAERFREADGPLSQDAIIAELRRENAQMRTALPGSIAQAKSGFDLQQRLIAKLPAVTPELQAWQALMQSGSFLYGPHPGQGLSPLSAAVRRARATPGFSPSLLVNLDVRFTSIYLVLSDGIHAERAARDSIAEMTAIFGPDSTELFQPEMFLEEALYLQGRYKDTMEQANRDYGRFQAVLGPQSLLTASALYMRAEGEAGLEEYAKAIPDELALSAAEQGNPSGKYLQEDSLSSAALYECHAGQFHSGIGHARQTIQESAGPPSPQPLFANFSHFVIAECLIAQDGSSGRAADLDEADRQLRSVDVALVTQGNGLSGFPGRFNMAEARLAFLRGERESARQYADKAEPFVSKPDADPYEKRALTTLRSALSSARPEKGRDGFKRRA